MKKNTLSPENQLMFAQIRLELLRFAIGVSGQNSTVIQIMDTVKTFNEFCFIEDETLVVHLETKGEA